MPNEKGSTLARGCDAADLYPDVHASGTVPSGWVPTKGGTIKYPVCNPSVRGYLRQLLPGKWQKVIKNGNSGEVHYFEHASGQVAGVKYHSNEATP
jgi:hypothetical protein